MTILDNTHCLLSGTISAADGMWKDLADFLKTDFLPEGQSVFYAGKAKEQ